MDAVYLQNRYTRLFNIQLRKSVHYISGRRLVFANTADARSFYHSFSPDKKFTLQKLCRTTSPSAVVAALQRGQLKVYLPRGAETVGISRLRTAIRPVLAAIIAHEKTDAMAFFLVRSKDAGNVGAVHERLHRLLRTQLETSWYKCWEDPRAWHGRLRDRLEAVEYKVVVEALGFDAGRVPVTMFAEAYEVALLIGDHDETRVALECFLRGYSRFQQGLNTTQFTGGVLFEIILTAVLVMLTGRAGVAGTVTGRQPPVVRSLTRLGDLLQDLAGQLKHVKLLGPGKPQQAVAVAIPSTLADYAIEEKVPKPSEPPRPARVDTATVPPGKDVTDSTTLRQTGGGGFIDPADELYDAIRVSDTDVGTIANNTGIKPQNIQKVKDHVFYNEHLLDKYIDYGIPAERARFDSDLNQAQAWQRLEDGTHTDADITWLKHEAAERWYELRHNSGYTDAHNAAERKWTGNPWGKN